MPVRQKLIALALGAVAVAALPAQANAAAKLPVVKKVSPLKLAIGEKLTIRGKYFRKGNRKNTVVFQAKNGPAVFAKAGRSTTRRLTIVVPEKLGPHLLLRDGSPVATRFRIRVVAKRVSGATKTSRSPLIKPLGSGGVGTADCDQDGIGNADEADDDNDLLTDAREKELHTDPCLRDTDGDGLLDGWEQESALDLNSRAVPYPGKRPFPNALDPTDAGVDHDGDGMTALEEHTMWVRHGGAKAPITYSDGTQFTGGPALAPTTPLPGIPHVYVDFDRNSLLSDDEKDVDGDGLTNWDEQHGRMTQNWWDLTYQELPETRYPLTFAKLDYLDSDTDGDGVKDGDDDQDHDGYSNAFEVQRPDNWFTTYISHFWGPAPWAVWHAGSNPLARVQPFNPCKPHDSGYCHKHPPFDYYQDDEDWFAAAP